MDAQIDYNAGKPLKNRYIKIADINKGSYGHVSLARDINTDTLVAIKCLVSRQTTNKNGSNSKNISNNFCSTAEIQHEIKIHSMLKGHRNIVQLLDHFSIGSVEFLILEDCAQGDLYEAISAGNSPHESGCTTEFILQLVDALIFCHSQGVYHRDVKPENILIDKDGIVKLADWGLATFEKNATDFGVGSERYMAPELFDGQSLESYDAEKADIWSVGICLLNILFGRNPFTLATSRDKLFMDFAANREALFDIFPTMTPDTFSVLRHSLTMDPDNRSLQNMREAILLVNAWTTDEEFAATFEDKSSSVPTRDSGFAEASHSGQVSISVPADYIATSHSQKESASTSSSSIPIKIATPILIEEDVVKTQPSRLPLRTPTIMSYKQQSICHWDRKTQFTPPTHKFTFPNNNRNLGFRKNWNMRRRKGGFNNSPKRFNNTPSPNNNISSKQSMKSLSEVSYSDEDMFPMDEESSHIKLKPHFKKSKPGHYSPDSDSDIPSLSYTSSNSSKASIYIPPNRRRNAEGALLSSSKKNETPGIYRPPFLRKNPVSLPPNNLSNCNFSDSFIMSKSWSDLMSDEEDQFYTNEKHHDVDVDNLNKYLGSVSINDKSKSNPMNIPFQENWQNWVA